MFRPLLKKVFVWVFLLTLQLTIVRAQILFGEDTEPYKLACNQKKYMCLPSQTLESAFFELSLIDSMMLLDIKSPHKYVLKVSVANRAPLCIQFLGSKPSFCRNVIMIMCSSILSIKI